MSLLDKSGRLIIWDAIAPADEEFDEDGQSVTPDTVEGKSYRLEPHHPVSRNSSLSCIKFDPINLSYVSVS